MITNLQKAIVILDNLKKHSYKDIDISESIDILLDSIERKNFSLVKESFKRLDSKFCFFKQEYNFEVQHLILIGKNLKAHISEEFYNEQKIVYNTLVSLIFDDCQEADSEANFFPIRSEQDLESCLSKDLNTINNISQFIDKYEFDSKVVVLNITKNLKESIIYRESLLKSFDI